MEPREISEEHFAEGIPEANYFIGQLLISGRVKAVEVEDLAPDAGIDMSSAAPPEDPPTEQMTLLADVYEVHGVIGRACQVELSFGDTERESVTKWVNPDKYSREDPETKREKHHVQQQQQQGPKDEKQVAETITSFTWDREKGKISAKLVNVPEDPASQAKVQINIYTKGVLSGTRRSAYCFKMVDDFPMFLEGQPCKPRYYTLTCMPGVERQRTPPSVLMSVERGPGLVLDDKRNARKDVINSIYISGRTSSWPGASRAERRATC